MTDHNALEPCPFGCAPVDDAGTTLGVFTTESYEGWSVTCDTCGTEGPRYNSAAEAIAAWHRRAPIQAAESGMLDERARIVGWLRHDLDDWPDYVSPADLADAIEQGAHENG